MFAVGDVCSTWSESTTPYLCFSISMYMYFHISLFLFFRVSMFLFLPISMYLCFLVYIFGQSDHLLPQPMWQTCTMSVMGCPIVVGPETHILSRVISTKIQKDGCRTIFVTPDLSNTDSPRKSLSNTDDEILQQELLAKGKVCESIQILNPAVHHFGG